ncbi:hypothetical protein OTU49_002531, partial [Cherax quadricarinatus]
MALPRKISHSCSAGVLPTFTHLRVGRDGMVMVPAPTRPPAAHHGHVHIPHGSQLLRVWVEVRGAGLYVYPHRAASLPSLVVPQLDLCDVTVSREDTSPAYRVSLSLRGSEQASVYLSSEEEANMWATKLRVTAVRRSLQLEGLNLECGAADYPFPGTEGDACGDLSSCSCTPLHEDEVEEEDDEEELARKALNTVFGFLHPCYCEQDYPGSGDSCEAESQGEEDEEGEGGHCGPLLLETSADSVVNHGVRLRHPRRLCQESTRDDASRRELLQQMLTTKSLLEKKQKNRRSGAGAWMVTAGEVANEYDRAQHEAQQSALRKVVILRQRKNSTAIKMATLERQQSSKKKREADVTVQLEALRTRLSSLDTQLKESEQDTERMLQDLEHRRNQELHLIQDLGCVDEDLGNVTSCGSEDTNLLKGSRGGSLKGSSHGGSLKSSHGSTLMGSLPSIVVSSGERKSPEKIFGIKVGGFEGRLKGRNPLHFLDLKLRVSRRHKSSECLTTAATHTPDR